MWHCVPFNVQYLIEPIQSVVFKLDLDVGKEINTHGLNLYRVLYLNNGTGDLKVITEEIEPIQSVVFKFVQLLTIILQFNLYRVLYLNFNVQG